ncbi:hypothetical protein [Allokutzneria oryzae]|uniref:Uncharacterized protein n=1 Tax=Allokutzneria oryzae TaxID=1378989 RepID=A0ABV5ZW89_9PSEU
MDEPRWLAMVAAIMFVVTDGRPSSFGVAMPGDLGSQRLIGWSRAAAACAT